MKWTPRNGKGRIRDGINGAAHQRACGRSQLAVFSPERYDLDADVDACQPRHAIGLKARAIDHGPGLHGAGGGRQGHGPARGPDAVHPRVGLHHSPRSLEHPHVGARHRGIVHQPGFRDQDGGDSSHIRLQGLQLDGIDALQALQSVGRSPFRQFLQGRQLAFRCGDHELAAPAMGYSLRAGERRTSPPDPPDRAGRGGCPADSRGPRGSHRYCARSGARQPLSRPRGRSRGVPDLVSAMPVARPTRPPPMIATSYPDRSIKPRLSVAPPQL